MYLTPLIGLPYVLLLGVLGLFIGLTMAVAAMIALTKMALG